jgi:hypothetical protein
MADNNPRPPVVTVEYSISWSSQDASEVGTFDIPRDEWDAMTPAERVKRCEQTADEILENTVTWGWHIHDGADWAATEEDQWPSTA